MKIQILGSGGAFDETSTSYLINDTILVDCSDATFRKYLKSGLLKNVKHVFFTHRHSDHISGFESLIYYSSVLNNSFNKIDITFYGGSDILEYYKALACAINPLDGELHQPFEFIDLKLKTSSIHINGVFVENIPANHMNGTLPCNSFIFTQGNKKVIITGDMDSVNPLISPSIIDENTLLFHDMGWTGLPDVPENMKFHPRESEVFEFYGENKNIIGIHTGNDLVHYQKASKGKTFIL